MKRKMLLGIISCIEIFLIIYNSDHPDIKDFFYVSSGSWVILWFAVEGIVHITKPFQKILLPAIKWILLIVNVITSIFVPEYLYYPLFLFLMFHIIYPAFSKTADILEKFFEDRRLSEIRRQKWSEQENEERRKLQEMEDDIELAEVLWRDRMRKISEGTKTP